MSYTYRYPHPAVTADCVVLAQVPQGTYVLLVERKHPPFAGAWAFPGGFMNMDETADEAAKRELTEETGLCVDNLKQVGAFTKVDRDPRERVITIAFYTVLKQLKEVVGNDDAAQAKWFDIDNLPALAFDHAHILAQTLEKWNSERP